MRLAIVGCGLIGGKRAAAALVEGHAVTVVCDINTERAAALARSTGARVAMDWQEAVKADCDIVVVATTHALLAPVSIAAVQAGKHVLVEKPAGLNGAEVSAVAAEARKHNRLIKVGFNHRFHPGLWKAREMVATGAVGPLMFIRGRYGHGGRVGYDKEWRCVPEISGGGELIDQGAHLIDLSRWFLGDVTLDYGAALTSYWNISVDDNCFLALRGPKGEMAWLHASWSEWKNIFSFEIYGRDGKLTVEGLGGSYGVEKLTYHKMLPEMGPPETASWEYPFPDDSWIREYRDFSAAIAEGRRPVGDIDDAVAMHAIIDATYGRSGK
ncbi:Gfo/Idh/MocA family oxidoreductase [Ferrovibrio terrae]|uniref:Gfo/Idh/MocA family oxidoreductase n=1 Tax=Ferrovibrio terrae TaxID=2594003 RepID=A0A516GXV4_9PROT|nr:Gfo/Idh/MocA family oxidoreductase [Ferrovibrio terrae]QDO96353.1 Gfo/Idh/MocA family oxidoreductase [Ferrovibrio terrae]